MFDLKALQSDPKKFLMNNLLMVQYQAYQSGYRTPGVKRFVAEIEDTLTCKRRGTGIISKYKDKPVDVRPVNVTTGADPNGFNAYWLPYDQDFKHLVVLTDEADVMFTPLMDGCSFGFSDHGGGTYSASHGNLQTPMGRIDEAGLRQGMRFHKSTLHKSEYMTHPGGAENIKVSMVGVRMGKKWRFFYQQFNHKFEGSYLLNVDELKG